MAKAMGWCVPCHERGVTVQAVMVIDGDGYCQHCGTLPAAVPVPSVDDAPEPEPSRCSRGCGKSPHRGNCAGLAKVAKVSPAAPAAPVTSEFKAVAAKIDSFLGKAVALPPVVSVPLPKPLTEQERKSRMDKLVSKRVRIADIPPEVVPPRKPIGRIGELWLTLLALPPGEAECVENLDVPHAGYTVRHMFKKALKAQVDLRARRVGLQVYFWVGDGEAA